MNFQSLQEKDFLNPYYRKKPILQNEFEEFLKILKNYKENLNKNLKENEDALVANALKPFFENLGFESKSKAKQKGNSEVDLALFKSPINQIGGGGSKNLEVLIEAKIPHSKDFFTLSKPNCKALHEVILYYFRERERGNSSLKFIIISDFYHFYFFKASLFEEFFYQNSSFKKLWQNFNSPNSIFKGNTDEFYKECKKTLTSKEFSQSLTLKDSLIEATEQGFKYEKSLDILHIDLSPFLKEQKPIDQNHFKDLKIFFKVFHKDFLLDEFNPNDANTLNKAFYNELLYILGLGEFKQNAKIIIAESEESKKGAFTLYNAILQKCKDKEIFIAKSEGEKFESLMQLIILWLNRILFLKLIEASLVKFNDDKSLKFLNTNKVPHFSVLSGLFFEILAKNSQQRDATHLKELYYLPYLNSSLFEKQDIEKTLLDIKDLENEDFEYFKFTQIKDKNAKKKQGKAKLLSYLFEFLDSFDFGGDEEVSEFIEQKNDLISSSVLGLVFEKLNGYKEGSFYTPSFITSYMCKQSLQKVVIDKFNGAKSWDCKDINELKIRLDKLTDSSKGYKEANEIFNSIKICDPAVGSGHFLVSALNELIFLKFDLGILCEIDQEGHYHRLKDIKLQICNDEIIITDFKNKAFSYTLPAHENIESHRIQKALFETKKALIESCLFGVDINPNSCEITKLRLWIELLKHSYYKDIANKELETLPNIDINIKCGNSLISYFELNKSLTHYPNIKARMDRYKKAVNDYKEGFGDKALIYGEIRQLKESFKNFCFADKFKKEMKAFNKKCEIYSKKYGNFLAKDDENLSLYISANFGFFEFDEKEATKEFKEIQKEYENIFNLESNKPFEWRFEFPEVLDDDGNFVGFDLIIGNPPYMQVPKGLYSKDFYPFTEGKDKGKQNLYKVFIELAYNLTHKNSLISLITQSSIMCDLSAQHTRELLLKNTQIHYFIEFKDNEKIFNNVSQGVCILEFTKANPSKEQSFKIAIDNAETQMDKIVFESISQKQILEFFPLYEFPLIKRGEMPIVAKVKTGKITLKEMLISSLQGNINTIHLARIKSEKQTGVFLVKGENIHRWYLDDNFMNCVDTDETFKMYERNKEANIIALQGIHAATSVNRIHATLIESKNTKNFVFLDSTKILFVECKQEALLLLALLNSKLLNWLFRKTSTNNNINLYELESLPIPKITIKNQKIADKIITLVEQILTNKAKDKNSTTLELEKEIDDLVYKLYNLSDDEIKIIENKE